MTTEGNKQEKLIQEKLKLLPICRKILISNKPV